MSSLCLFSLKNSSPLPSTAVINSYFDQYLGACNQAEVKTLSDQAFSAVQFLQDETFCALVSPYALNDQRWLNKYLLCCRSKIKDEGYLLACFLPLEIRYEILKKKFPTFLLHVAWAAHFLIHRVLPKLSIASKCYFAVTKGKNRAISQTELYGRLNYCGFKLLSTHRIGDCIYFVAQKNGAVSDVKHPTYGLMIKLRRVGQGGKIIFIRKLRTMHPYSEFLQQDIYNSNKLDKTGKIAGDFRLTGWGRFLRRFWIDELPQLYDWLCGNLKFFGVRALSEHYFSLYPKELQELRVREKPGLMPPYYADMPQNFAEILDSERRYLLRKAQYPYSTDFIYFFRALKNIVFKGARSR